MKIPFVDLGAQYRAHKAEFDAAFSEVIGKSAFIGGEYVKAFESEYATAYGIKHCIAVANGTDAIYIVLKMLGIGAGDEVITTAMSWISTSETISQTGARPVFVDICETGNIDAAAIPAKVSPRTKAVIPVHLYGQAAQIDVVQDVCARRNLFLVEDCAQAHFASFRGRRVGTIGTAGTFSFYPGKNLGAYGDAGAIVTNDDELARKCRMYANHGALKKHEHMIEGINSRMDGLQAALLTKKLGHIARWTERRRQVAEHYRRRLAGIRQVALPVCSDGATHVYHLFVVRVPERERLRDVLSAKGIETAVHYPTALPLLPAYAYLGHKANDFPRASRAQREILSLPICPEMTAEMVDYVCDTIGEFFSS
jgi:dTDP-4-amino-4,6-dideoxygalactose transaminase